MNPFLDTKDEALESELQKLSFKVSQVGMDDLCADMKTLITDFAKKSGAHEEMKQHKAPRRKQRKSEALHWVDWKCVSERKRWYLIK